MIETMNVIFNKTTEKREENLTIVGRRFETVEQLSDSDEMFWNDLYLRQSYENGMFYIQDTNGDKWYCIENRFAYCTDLQLLLDRNENIKFYLITDEEILDEIENEFD